jgi:hypothetical protein
MNPLTIPHRVILSYDELLIERNRKGRYWVHFAVRPPKEGNRRKVMFIQT